MRVRSGLQHPLPVRAVDGVNRKVYNMHCSMTRRADNLNIGRIFPCIRDGAGAYRNWRGVSECKRLFATKLLPYLLTKEELAFEIERARRRRAR